MKGLYAKITFRDPNKASVEFAVGPGATIDFGLEGERIWKIQFYERE